jgi:hypothetical protein
MKIKAWSISAVAFRAVQWALWLKAHRPVFQPALAQQAEFR